MLTRGWVFVFFSLVFWASSAAQRRVPRPGENERIPVAFVFHYIPDHGELKITVPYWHDPGFRGALKLLHVEHKIDPVLYNLAEEGVQRQLESAVFDNAFAFVLAKGCWHTPADKVMRGSIIPRKPAAVKTGLFPACSSPPPNDEVKGTSIDLVYDTIYYDKQWLSETFKHHPRAVHAFGVDTPNTFNNSGIGWEDHPKIFDYVSIGIFAPWKRHEMLMSKEGERLVVGYGWRSEESSQIVSTLYACHSLSHWHFLYLRISTWLLHTRSSQSHVELRRFSAGIGVWQRVPPWRMCAVYKSTNKLLMAANEMGGGERVILEARSCGLPAERIELAPDNKRLLEFIEGPIYDTSYYASQFAKGIRGALQADVEVLSSSGSESDGGEAPGSSNPAPFRISI